MRQIYHLGARWTCDNFSMQKETTLKVWRTPSAIGLIRVGKWFLQLAAHLHAHQAGLIRTPALSLCWQRVVAFSTNAEAPRIDIPIPFAMSSVLYSVSHTDESYLRRFGLSSLFSGYSRG